MFKWNLNKIELKALRFLASKYDLKTVFFLGFPVNFGNDHNILDDKWDIY